MSSQNYKNHRRLVPGYHFVLYFILLVCIAASAYGLYVAFHLRHGRFTMGLFLLLSIAALLITFFMRSFALKAQDRAIRAEENLRHFALTGKVLDSRLRISQIIALRFAEDNEFVLLAKRAADENMKADDIKKTIIHWREDHHRV